jgi:hypothetical protein
MESQLWEECSFTYIKANRLNKVNEILKHKRDCDKSIELDIDDFIFYLHSIGITTHFNSQNQEVDL